MCLRQCEKKDEVFGLDFVAHVEATGSKKKKKWKGRAHIMKPSGILYGNLVRVLNRTKLIGDFYDEYEH